MSKPWVCAGGRTRSGFDEPDQFSKDAACASGGVRTPEAQRYGVAVHHSELVGLIPQKALTDAAVWYLQLDQYEDEQLLENKLMSAAFEQSPVAGGSRQLPFG
jgi:hypothetical protein